MSKELKVKDLPKSAKVSATHALIELGFSVRKSAKILGIGKGSVENYLKEIPDEKWDEFRTALKKLVRLKEDDIATRTLGQIGKKLPKAEFNELIRLYKTIRDLQGRGEGSQEEDTSPIKVEINQRIINIMIEAEKKLDSELLDELKDHYKNK